MPAETSSPKRKRSLILAGGGIKVAFQAGVLEVWLDEAGLEFDHVDGASGGVFNLAMVCQGRGGREIADAWRRTKPVDGVALNGPELKNLFFARSLFTLDAYRENVFAGWGLDWQKIRASKVDATFSTYNFSRHELRVLPPAEMDEDMLCACVSLPMFFPPVERDGDTYIDAVYITDANLEEALKRGADEIWVIWTVSDAGVWRDGFIANYFQIIETAAVGHFKRICDRIERSNQAIAAGGRGEFEKHVELKILKAEVPLHYLINFSADRLTESVNLGVERGRAWCAEQGIPLKKKGKDYPTEVHSVNTALQFTEQMKGFVSGGEKDFDKGYRRGKSRGTALNFELTIQIDGVNRFVTDPQHEADAVGWVEGPLIGGRRQVDKGVFNLFVDAQNPTRKAMHYRLFFKDAKGKQLTLLGYKDIKDDPGSDVWEDTTTLYTKLLEGEVEVGEEGNAKQLAIGILKIHLTDFLKQLTTFRVEAPTLADRSAALGRFGRLFMGKLWDVYATHILPFGPL